MGPQEHAFRSGVDVLVATPGRLLDHFRAPYAKLTGLECLVLDEADRMLDMGFLPDIRRVLRHLPTKRQTMFFSATMPPPIGQLAGEMLRDPVSINQERRALAGDRHHAGDLSGGASPQGAAAAGAASGWKCATLVFTGRSIGRPPGQHLGQNQVKVERFTATDRRRSEQALADSRAAVCVLVATDIAARGIDVTALGHVINFDAPDSRRTTSTASAGRRGRNDWFRVHLRGAGRGRERACDRGGRSPSGCRASRFRFRLSGRAASLEVPHAQRIAEIPQAEGRSGCGSG
jgi:ATP-dependent RNA helicase RhlE